MAFQAAGPVPWSPGDPIFDILNVGDEHQANHPTRVAALAARAVRGPWARLLVVRNRAERFASGTMPGLGARWLPGLGNAGHAHANAASRSRQRPVRQGHKPNAVSQCITNPRTTGASRARIGADARGSRSGVAILGELKRVPLRTAWWARGAHLQTLWPTFFRPRRPPALRRKRIELEDGDFIDLDLARDARGPVVLVIHGLEGDLRSHYAAGMTAALARAGYRPAFMYLRGRSGEPNRLPRSYHSGATEDLAAVLDHLAPPPGPPLAAAVGYSLGGNLLLKYLGETRAPRLDAAVAVSVPFLLRDAMLRLNIGPSRIYRRYLMGRLKRSYRTKFPDPGSSPVDVSLDELADLYDYDDRITAPLNGFQGADDYYARCSCRPLLARIDTPTLILHAQDDPFMFPHTVPRREELGAGVRLELTSGGGHVGFVTGTIPWRPDYWAETRALDWLRQWVPVSGE